MKVRMLSKWEFDEDFKKTVIKDDRMREKEFERSNDIHGLNGMTWCRSGLARRS